MPTSVVASDLVKSSMRLIGAIATGETPTADELFDGLFTLNDMLENLSTESQSVWGVANMAFTLVPGQSTYTIGPGGNFNAARPVRISDAYVTFSGTDFPIEIVNQIQYNDISQKAQQQSVPERLLYVNDVPLGRLTFWPVPTQALTVTLSINRLLAFPVTGNTVIAGPPGFAKMLRYNLACEFAPDFGVEPSPSVVAIASDSKADYKRANGVSTMSKFDLALAPNPGWGY